MNALKFEIREDNRVDILINDENLIDILRKYELPFATKEGSESIAGGYGGIYKDILLENLQLKQGDKKNILGCQCGEAGCWPMNITITEEDNKIIWSNFEQPFRTKDSHNFWDYSNFESFVFDKEQYQHELNKLKS